MVVVAIVALAIECRLTVSSSAQTGKADTIESLMQMFADAKKDGPAFTQELTDAKGAGLPVEAKDLQAPLPPSDRNAAALYARMDALLKAHPLNEMDKAVEVLPLTPTAAQVNATRRAQQRRSDLIALIHSIVARPDCVFERDWSNPETVPMPEFARMRMAARIITAESRVLDSDGKPLEAVRNQALGFRIAQHAASENLLIGYLVGHAVDAITLSGLQQILYRDGGDPAVCEAVRATVEQDYKPSDLAHALRTEFCMQMVILARLRKGGPNSLVELSGEPASQSPMKMSPEYWNAFLDASGLKMIRRTRRIIATADLPFPEAFHAQNALENEVEQDKSLTNMVCDILFPAFANVSIGRASHQAMAEVTRAGAAVLVWRARQGPFPDSLEAVMNPVPVDPFDGKPLRYRREGAGFVVYAVGKDGKFDGGTPDKKPEAANVAFHYPMPSYLKHK
jgi:hypothetical protein